MYIIILCSLSNEHMCYLKPDYYRLKLFIVFKSDL